MENKAPMIFSKMADIMQEINAIGKDQTNTQQKYNFRGIDDVYNAVNPLLKKHRVFITTKILSSKREERTTKPTSTNPTGTVMIYTILEIENTFWAEDGSSVSSISQGEAMDSADKGSNKAMSAAQKYSLIQTFAIPTKEGSPDTDKPDIADKDQLQAMKDEVDRFTEMDKLISWANDQGEWSKNPEFYKHVTEAIKKLKPKANGTGN